MALPDKEIHMDEVHKLAEKARENPTIDSVPSCGQENGWDREMQNARAEIEATSPKTATATPIYLGKAHEVVPHSYMMHYKVQHCTNCGADVMLTAFYAKSHIRSRVTGKAVTHLTPCDKPLYNLSVEKAFVGRTEVPFCHGCEATVDLSNLPYPPSAAQLYDLDEPRLKGQKPPKEAKAKAEVKSKKATLDDLA